MSMRNCSENLITLAKGARILGLPVLWVEQLPDKLGSTIPDLAEVLEGCSRFDKKTFSCMKHKEFAQALKDTRCTNVLVAGIEAHICVYQTVMDLHDKGYDVEVVGDAISSRTEQNMNIALDKMAATGVNLTSVEMVLFELMQRADDPDFREIQKLVK